MHATNRQRLQRLEALALFAGQRLAPGQDHARMARLAEYRLGEYDAETAETAGDQVDAVLLEDRFGLHAVALLPVQRERLGVAFVADHAFGRMHLPPARAAGPALPW